MDPIDIHNNNLLNFNTIAINFAIELYNIIREDGHLPDGCTLVRRTEEDDSYVIVINCVNPLSIFNCQILMTIPYEYETFVIEEGFVKILADINAHNGYFLNITAHTIDEMYEAIAFCQTLLQYQPNEEENNLIYVRVPNQLLDHWCATPSLRAANIYPPEPEMHPQLEI
jgi:hypothetical protein